MLLTQERVFKHMDIIHSIYKDKTKNSSTSTTSAHLLPLTLSEKKRMESICLLSKLLVELWISGFYWESKALRQLWISSKFSLEDLLFHHFGHWDSTNADGDTKISPTYRMFYRHTNKINSLWTQFGQISII